MNSSTLLERVATTSSYQIAYLGLPETHDSVGTVFVRPVEQIIEDFWRIWRPLVPPRLSTDDMQALLAERPELPADQDPATREFLRPED